MANPNAIGACATLHGQSNLSEGAEHGLGYASVALAEGGWGSVCNADLSMSLTAMTDAMIHNASLTPLGAEAIPSTIRVAINGELLARHPGSDGDQPFWRYGVITDEISGRTRPGITLFNLQNLRHPPTPGDANDDDDIVIIGYRRWVNIGE